MALMLRRQYVQDRIEGRESSGYSVDDYAVVDGTRIGRIWREVQNGAAKWLWSLQVAPAQPAEHGNVDTLEQARAAVSKRWAEVTKGIDRHGRVDRRSAPGSDPKTDDTTA